MLARGVNRYEKVQKAVYCEALMVGGNGFEIMDFVQGDFVQFVGIRDGYKIEEQVVGDSDEDMKREDLAVIISTSRGEVVAKRGDFILKGRTGKLSVMKSQDFMDRYQMV